MRCRAYLCWIASLVSGGGADSDESELSTRYLLKAPEFMQIRRTISKIQKEEKTKLEIEKAKEYGDASIV